MNGQELECQFHHAMLNIYDEAVQNGYPPSKFREMIENYGGWKLARHLLKEPPSLQAERALRELQKRGCLGVSMEALVMQRRWARLFTDGEREIARKRLESLLSEPLPPF